MDDKARIWQSADEILKNEFSSASYNSWFASLKPVSLSGNLFVLSAPHIGQVSLLKSSYIPRLEDIICEVSGEEYRINIIVEEEKKEVPEFERDVADVPANIANTSSHTQSFNNFVVGSSNELAYNASLAICNTPGTKYNPLLIYGGSGLGKTHLLKAIECELSQTHPEWKIKYISTESFTNDFQNALRFKTNKAFRDKYRGLDVLLIDDIQFLAKKERTQEEFFHTFNDLISYGKQIVLTSDKPPYELQTLEHRLRTRFEAGLVVDVSTPDYETRLAILKEKLEGSEFSEKISEEVIEWVASRVKNSIRELEGAILKLTARCEMTNEDIDLKVADMMLGSYFDGVNSNVIDTADIIRAVEDYFHLHKDELASNTKVAKILKPRQIAMYLCRTMTDHSLPEIGDAFGGKKHTTVMHAVSKIKDEMEKNLSLMNNIKSIIESLK